jgi:hypothetical protein
MSNHPLVSFPRFATMQDPNRPKRAMSAFFLYSQGNRTTTKENNPDASFGEIVSLEKTLRIRICADWL